MKLKARPGRTTRATLVHASRYTATLLTILVAVVAAVVAARLFAIGVPSGGFKSLSELGEMRTVRLPIGARRLEEIRSFVIKMGGADDYGRVFTNNYLVLNKEAPNLFYTDAGLAVNRQLAESKKERRNVQLPPENDVKGYLRRGTNFIVAELENASGPCAFAVDIVVNGVQLEGFPTIVPTRFDVDRASVNATLFQKFEKVRENDTADRRFTPDPYDEVVCGRRIFQVDLD